VVEGLDLARARRGERAADPALARGPGNLCQALGIDRRQNGADLVGDDLLRLRRGGQVDPARVLSGHRVGVSIAHDVPWRFWVAGEPSVSAYKRSPRAPLPERAPRPVDEAG
jgi:DNA-3-methyladenine glycosylase